MQQCKGPDSEGHISRGSRNIQTQTEHCAKHRTFRSRAGLTQDAGVGGAAKAWRGRWDLPTLIWELCR